MVKNILDVLEDLFFNIKARGFEYEIPLKVLSAEIKRATHVLSDKAVSNAIKVLKDLGYVKDKGNGIMELCENVNAPYVFRSEKRGE